VFGVAKDHLEVAEGLDLLTLVHRGRHVLRGVADYRPLARVGRVVLDELGTAARGGGAGLLGADVVEVAAHLTLDLDEPVAGKDRLVPNRLAAGEKRIGGGGPWGRERRTAQCDPVHYGQYGACRR